MSDADDANLHRAERIVGNLLRVGVVASLLLLVAGTVISFAGHDYDDLGQLVGASRKSLDFHRGMGPTLVAVGLLVLIATPILRVVASIVAFAMVRDTAFVLLTVIVLALLAASAFFGAAHG